jgi:peptidoglycan/LPS O-acetylase OafA/YrhL
LSSRFAFADGLRGLAAFWVVLYHLYHGHHIDVLASYVGEILSNLFFIHGNLGVPVFFVLSGFVMAVTTTKKTFNLTTSLRFLVRRFLRLSPPYYLSIIVSLLVLFTKSQSVAPDTQLPSLGSIFAHLLYLQDSLGYPQINVVYWTLTFEIQFYLVFSLLLFLIGRFDSKYIVKQGIIILFTLAGVLWILNPSFNKELSHLNFFKYFFFIKYWYAFSAGLLTGWIFSFSKKFTIYSLSYFWIILFYGCMTSDLFAIAVALASMLLSIAIWQGKMNQWLNWSGLQWLGLISYSLYLIHNSVTGVVAFLVRKVLPYGLTTDIVVLMVVITTCLVASSLMYKFVELPVIKMSQRIKY